jgi:hypothetical protein
MKAAHTSWTLLFVVLLASSIGAQGSRGGGSFAAGQGHHSGTFMPTPPPIVLPMKPILTPQPVTRSGQPRDVFRANPFTYAPRYDRVGRVPPGYYAGGGYSSWPDGADTATVDPGYIQLDVQPSTAQVFVDGLYVGDASDLRREGGRKVDAGAHHVDIRSDGYETASVDVRVDPSDTTVYRTQLKPIVSAAARVAAVPAKPKTFYVIAGCYAGDTKPVDSQLPRGCDPAKLRAVPPVVSRVGAQ